MQYRDPRKILLHVRTGLLDGLACSLCVQAEVRNHALELMHRDSNADPIPVVSAERADHYARTKRREDGPTSDVFALDFMDNLGSHWNMRAKAVFAESFIQSGYSCKDKREVQRVFTVHVGTLRRQFKVLMRDPDYEPTPEELEQEKARNRAARRREVRLLIANYERVECDCSFSSGSAAATGVKG